MLLLCRVQLVAAVAVLPSCRSRIAGDAAVIRSRGPFEAGGTGVVKLWLVAVYILVGFAYPTWVKAGKAADALLHISSCCTCEAGRRKSFPFGCDTVHAGPHHRKFKLSGSTRVCDTGVARPVRGNTVDTPVAIKNCRAQDRTLRLGHSCKRAGKMHNIKVLQAVRLLAQPWHDWVNQG